MDRRRFLALTAAAAACKDAKPDSGLDTEAPVGSPERDAEPVEWEPEGALDAAVFAWGVQTGDATADSVQVSIRCTEPSLRVGVVVADGEAWTQEREEEHDCDHRASFSLDGLSPDTAYRLVAYASEGRSAVARFRTALAEDQDRKLVFGVTSCIGRPNAPWPNLALVPGEELDFFGLLGDTVYADDARTLDEYRGFYDEAYSTEGLYLAALSTSMVATWDDHEVTNNWDSEDVAESRIADAKAAFLEACPQVLGPDGVMWRSLRWGTVVEIFVLDSRGERDHATGQYLSEAQKTWLLEGVSNSPAAFKLVFNSVPITDLTDLLGDAQAADRWSGFPTQRAEVLSALDDVPGVIWLTGDLHFAALTWTGKLGDPGAAQPEVLCGPSGSNRNPLAALYTGDTTQFPILLSEWNWVRFEADAALGTLRVQFIGDDASVLAESTLVL